MLINSILINNNFLYYLGGVVGAIELAITYPLDFHKTKM